MKALEKLDSHLKTRLTDLSKAKEGVCPSIKTPVIKGTALSPI